MEKRQILPGEKYALTIDEAAVYFGIGTKKLRQLITEQDSLVLHNGVKVLIKRQKFEEFLDQTTEI